MIHEIAPHRFDNQYRPATPRPEDMLILWKDGRDGGVYARNDEALCFPRRKEVSDLGDEAPIYLFSIDDTAYFLAPTAAAPEGYEPLDIRRLRRAEPLHEAFAGMTAIHLARWYGVNRFCGRCGKRTEHDAALRALRCPHCRNLIFPKICPAVVVAVTDGEKLLVSKYNGRGNTFYALIAGFVEIGETAEECVAREVMEEVGLRVKDIRYYASQPWGFDGNLMLGFTAKLDGSPDIRLDREELSEALWLRPDELGELPESSSLTREIIRRFRDGERF